MVQIFINENKLILTDLYSVEDKNTIPFTNVGDIETSVDRLFKSEVKTITITHDNLDVLWSEFQNQYKIIEAAGGVVLNERDEILWIHRLGKWDLPKGKREKNEGIEETAVREVEEECGITNVNLNRFITETYHMYKTKQITLKKTFWYEMFYTGNETLIAQSEEGIEQAIWQPKHKTEELLNDSYGNIRLVLQGF